MNSVPLYVTRISRSPNFAIQCSLIIEALQWGTVLSAT